MLKSKRLKDPLYGYIEIEEDIMEDIVDTANFQRLRNIIQTSYSPLYSSAVHNRFVHSIGVYYLGRLASQSLMETINHIDEKLKLKIIRYIKIFNYACLLHDVGHAPFSHTGEIFYLNAEGSRDELHNEIIRLTNDNNLQNEIHNKNYSAAPHELMSVVVGLKIYSDLFKNDEEKSFFARCITGYLYIKSMDQEKSLLNCMIYLLNSSIIDVDKLDYLIRDAFITGFDTVIIDYKRLLSSIKLVKINNMYEIVYAKGAISVIENVVYAHDAERKWIQNHPIVQYESYIIKHAIEVINKKYCKDKIFSYDFLTVTGKEIYYDLKISLLSDPDMIFLMKNLQNDSFIQEYFSRKNRRHPMWKSESEYKAFFKNELFEIVEEEFDELSKYLNNICKSLEINENAIKNCEIDILNHEKILVSSLTNRELMEKAITTKKKHMKWLVCLREYALEQKLDFDFVIIKANQFNSGFGKIEFNNIKIEFSGLKKPCCFSDVTNVPKAQKSDRDKFFYLYYRRRNKYDKIDLSVLASKLGKLSIEEKFENM